MIPQKEIWMKEGILFPSLQRDSLLENTPVSNENFNLLSTVSLSHSIGWEWETMENETDRRSRKANFFDAATSDSLLADFHFAVYMWDSEVRLLTGYLLPEDESQWKEFCEGLEVSHSSWIEEKRN